MFRAPIKGTKFCETFQVVRGSPTTESLERYVKESIKELENYIKGIKILRNESYVLAGRSGWRIDYTGQVGGNYYRWWTANTFVNNLPFILTFTSLPQVDAQIDQIADIMFRSFEILVGAATQLKIETPTRKKFDFSLSAWRGRESAGKADAEVMITVLQRLFTLPRKSIGELEDEINALKRAPLVPSRPFENLSWDETTILTAIIRDLQGIFALQFLGKRAIPNDTLRGMTTDQIGDGPDDDLTGWRLHAYVHR